MTTVSANGSETETTPLLAREEVKEQKWSKSVLYRALLAAFLISMSFGVTQVPILYIFRVMTCDAFYETHPLPHHDGDHCSRREIESGTALGYSLLGASTTVFGIINLFVTGWAIKRFGVKTALLIQVFWSAVRLLIQNIGAMTGSNLGIIIFQCSQIITIIGGPYGYVLALNSFITDVTDNEKRTGALGQLQGCMLVGMAVGFLIGGVVGEYLGILAPFRMTLALFLLCSVYVVVSLPAIPTQKDVAAARQTNGIKQYLGPLRVFAPQKWTLLDGRTITHFGTLALGTGVFLAILATGYIPTMLQMYATNSFSFGTSANGWLIFIYSSLRGLFLTLVFPRIITLGRKWLDSRPGHLPSGVDVGRLQDDEPQDIPTSPAEIGPIDNMDNNLEPETPAKRHVEGETYAFDLVYARLSLLADVVLCGLATFATKGWHLYLAAIFLPLSAGTGSAAKGSVLQMIPSHERVDALSGITLIENVARLSTTAVFGLIFAALANAELTHFVFLCNAGVALIGFLVLLLSRFPPAGSRRCEE